MIYCAPNVDGITLAQRMDSVRPKRVLILFYHGVGDMVMFQMPFRKLQAMWIDVEFVVGVIPGLTFPSVFDCIEVNGKDDPITQEFDLVADLQFPMSEHDDSMTKGEYCCRKELGIEPLADMPKWPSRNNPENSRLCGVHFHCTCLPGSAGMVEWQAKALVEEIVDAGWIPFDTHVEHTFHNPANTGWDFLPSPMRKIKPVLSTLKSAIGSCGAFLGTASGNWCMACCILPPERVRFLQKDFKAKSYFRQYDNSFDMKHYQPGSVKEWLSTLT